MHRNRKNKHPSNSEKGAAKFLSKAPQKNFRNMFCRPWKSCPLRMKRRKPYMENTCLCDNDMQLLVSITRPPNPFPAYIDFLPKREASLYQSEIPMRFTIGGPDRENNLTSSTLIADVFLSMPKWLMVKKEVK